MFKRTFDLERKRYALALHQSIQDVLSRLPRDILDMPAEEFVSRVSDSAVFEREYNKSFNAPSTSNQCLDVLGNISDLLTIGTEQKQAERNERRQPELTHGVNAGTSMITGELPRSDKEVQCRFSIARLSQSEIESPAKVEVAELGLQAGSPHIIEESPPALH